MLHCECGFEARAADEEGLVAEVRRHAREAHGMALSHDEALLLAFRAELDASSAGHDSAREDNRDERRGMKRVFRWALLSVGFAGVMVTAIVVAPGSATPPSGLTNVPLARGTTGHMGTIPLRFGTDVAMAQITVDPGGSSGWHSHPGGAIIVVKQGALTGVLAGRRTDARSRRTARGRRSSSDQAKWIT